MASSHVHPTETSPLLGDVPPSASTATSSPDDNDEISVVASEIPPARLYLILGATYLGIFLGAIDTTVIATLSAPISSEFKSMQLFSWIATAYLISNAACQPLSGRLTDIFGRGPGLVFSNLCFALGNLMCGLAHSEGTMIAGRVVAGIGGGGIMSIGTFLASDLVPLRQRGVIQGIGNICYSAGAMLGGLFGGWVNDHTANGWRLAFLLLVPPTLISAGLVVVLVRVPPKASASGRGYLRRIDFSGAALTVLFLVLLLFGLNAGGNLVPWTHPLPLISLSLSAVAFAGFVWWEGTRAQQPIVPVRLLVDRTVGFACLTNFCVTMVMLAVLFYIPLYLQVLGRSATDSGVVLLFAPIGVSVCSLGSGYLMKRTGRYLTLGIAMVAMFQLGAMITLSFGQTTALGWVRAACFFMGGGYGAMLTVTLLACISAVDHGQQAVITAATYLFRSLGSTLGITIASSVFQNILSNRLWDAFGDKPDAAVIIGRILKSIESMRDLPTEWQGLAVEAYMAAFRGVWFSMFGIGAAGLVCVCLMKEHHLHETLDRREGR
ncbi:Multidrug resistance protein fnx1 [Ceratocystis fimbriata CBS 114723]|uniref:Multidrug resistance protein fnx1 n=1 Tax=Ceratocystis fimbriata CBS 114723 TaxID=1035309 RepID=A0A2C5XHT7_9PEZI|nr:Multidrug resistance protein fnx1 [Ceratocystis fimbriata CBS 114723]